jgi:adenosylhomocysteine nucleosidase
MKRTIVLFILFTLFSFLSIARNGFQSSFEIVEKDTVPRIAVISAMDKELELLRDSAEIQSKIILNGRTLLLGKLRNQDVALFLSGNSMVNATLTTEAVLSKLNIKAIVFSGIAGGANPSLNVGDVAVAKQWGMYQEQRFARKTDAGWDAGTSKNLYPNFGMMFPKNTSVARVGNKPDSVESRLWFPVDTNLLAVAKTLSKDIPLKKCVNNGKDCLEHQPQLIVGGNGVSGSTFVDNAEYRTYVWETFHADALDMETAAVALVAFVHRVPFIAFRSLSDLAGGGAGKNEGKTFGKLASDNSATVVLAFLAKLPVNKK